VRFTKKIDHDDHYGLLHMTGHLVVLKRGQVIETKNTWCGIYDVEDYIVYAANLGMRVEGIWLCQE
jgi:hypothetical protein